MILFECFFFVKYWVCSGLIVDAGGGFEDLFIYLYLFLLIFVFGLICLGYLFRVYLLKNGLICDFYVLFGPFFV